MPVRPNVITAEDLSAHVDGQLDSAASARVEEAIATDAQIAHTVEELRSQTARLRQLFGGIASEPVPDRFARTLQRHRLRLS